MSQPTSPLTGTPVSKADVAGQFVWHDFMTPSVAEARAFYTSVLGWGIEMWGGEEGYAMWTVNGQPRGGFGPFTDEMRTQGVPAHWLTYIGVADVDAKVAEAVRMGATTVHGPEDIPDVGRFAILRDPQGAHFSVFASNQPMPVAMGAAVPVGDTSWHELWTTDTAAAYEFYTKLFGWRSAGEFADPNIGVYRMFGLGEADLGGIAQITAEMEGMPPNWLPYFRVSDLEEAIVRVKANGGKILVGPMEVPGGDRIAQCLDAQGGSFALHGPRASAG